MARKTVDRGKWKGLPPRERIAYANKLIVLHPRFQDAIKLLQRCHRESRISDEPVCGALLGASGVGKTTVIDHYRRDH